MEKICQTGFMKKRIFWLKSWKKKKFGQFPIPWALRVSWMGCYTSKCEKSQNHSTILYIYCTCPWCEWSWGWWQDPGASWRLRPGQGFCTRPSQSSVSYKYKKICRGSSFIAFIDKNDQKVVSLRDIAIADLVLLYYFTILLRVW